MSEVLNYIQRHILTKLLRSSEPMRYREMKPDDVENDLYNYHLQFLVKKGLVEKVESKYTLSDYGKKFVVEINPIDAKGQLQEKFKVNVLANLIKVEGSKILVLNQIRKRHPFYGQHTTVGGNLHKGESITNAAARNLFEKTGLTAEFTLVGNVRRAIFESDKNVFNDMIFYICVSDKFEGKLISENEYGENYWDTIENTIQKLSDFAVPFEPLINMFKDIKSGKDFRKLKFCEESIGQVFNV